MALSNELTSNFWVNTVKTLGIPTVVALFLIWFLTQSVTDGLAQHQSDMRTHEAVSATFRQTVITHEANRERQNEQTLQLLRRICVNTATTELQRSACLQ